MLFFLLFIGISIPNNCSVFKISNYTAYFFDLAANIKHVEKLVLYGFVRRKTLKNAKKAIMNKNMNENQKVENLFQIGFEFAGHVLNNYWVLKPHIQKRVNDFIMQKFKGNFIIGFQMRFEYLDKADIEHFINCALKIENNIFKLNKRTVKWFIITDQYAKIEYLIKTYKNKILTGDGKIGHVAYESDSYERALFDIELLSYCNEIILTGGSTFGFIGSIKNQKRPYYVEGKRSMNMCKLLDFNAPARTPTGYAMF